ncbi:MAG: hypothetical protein AAAB35_10345 [Phyllobacterium sp.]|uniref:hypothetical protein n=1 Tax=Phyllobacterium sp. TaxID=1871046 RepID=UPI0030F2FB27
MSEEILKYAHAITKALTGLAGGGSELFDKEVCGIYLADIERCVQRVRDREEKQREHLKRTIQRLNEVRRIGSTA